MRDHFMEPARILLVEDSESDIELVRHSMKKNKVHIELDVVKNGDDASDFLEKTGSFSDAKTPSMIILDINLPGKSGIEILHEIKTNDNTKHIPVVMLTSSKHDQDVINAYGNYANCYIQKPLEFESFQGLLSQFEEFWFTIVTLPDHAKSH